MSDRRQAATINPLAAHETKGTKWTATERGVVFASVVATSMAFIDATALNVAIPALQKDLHASGPDVLWTINAYGIVVAALLLLGGVLGDRFGRRRVCTLGIIVFATASLACGLCTRTSMLIAARSVQGAGAALMIPASLAMITASVHPSRRGQAIGVWSALSVVASALGPILGGTLARAGLWRGVFLINLPLAIVAVASLFNWVPESRDDEASPKMDLLGACCAVATLLGINVGLIEATTRGFRDPMVLGSLGFALIGGVVFIRIQQRSTRPILPLTLFRDRTLSAVCLLTLLFYSGIYGMMFFLSLNLIEVQQYDAAQAGMAQTPLMVLVVVLSGWAGSVCDRRGARLLLIAGPCLAGLGFLGLAVPGVTTGPKAYCQTFLPPLLVIGTAMGITIAPLSSSLMTAVSSRQAGLASGINSTVSRLSSVLGVALLGSVGMGVFAHALHQQTVTLKLNVLQRTELQDQASRFTQAAPPPGLSLHTRHSVEQALEGSFVMAFRAVSFLCAGAAWLGAGVAIVWIPRPAALVERIT